MKNHYLNIENQEDGKIYMSAFDGAFGYSATCNDKEDFLKYCDRLAGRWLNSTWVPFECWKKKDRKEIAGKWLAAKELPEGEYNYYFNLGDIRDTFRESVTELAKSMNITDYELIVK